MLNSQVSGLRSQVSGIFLKGFLMPCFHGGRQFDTIGVDFSKISKHSTVIALDVLDAWYEPSPHVLDLLNKTPMMNEWSIRTSPPDTCQGLVDAIAEYYKISSDHIIVGSGSSDLIFRFLPKFLDPRGVLIVKPAYGEYEFVAKLNQYPVYSFFTDSNDFCIHFDELLRKIFELQPALVCLINPNNPTGHFIKRSDVIELIEKLPEKTQLIIDETYSEYTKQSQSTSCSVIDLAGQTDRVAIFKSMSKIFALSGMRVGFLVSSKCKELQKWNPPYAVGNLAQQMAIEALRDPDYYYQKIAETHLIRRNFIKKLHLEFPKLKIFSSSINLVCIDFSSLQISAAKILNMLKKKDILVRLIDSQGVTKYDSYIRIAVQGQNKMNLIFNELASIIGGEIAL